MILVPGGGEVTAAKALGLGAAGCLVKDKAGGYLKLLPAMIAQVLERRRLSRKLAQALAEIEALSGLLPVCPCCRKIREDPGYWARLEEHLKHQDRAFACLSLCPACAEKLASDQAE